jgi:hypothetical protein
MGDLSAAAITLRDQVADRVGKLFILTFAPLCFLLTSCPTVFMFPLS